MSEFLAFASALSQRIAQFSADTGIRAQPSVDLVSCGCVDRHFLHPTALETHLRAVHGIKHAAHASHQFFYANAPGVERITRGAAGREDHQATTTEDKAAASASSGSDVNALTLSDNTPTEEHGGGEQDSNVAEPLTQSLLEPLEPAAAELHGEESTMPAAAGTQDACERVVNAISAMAADAGEFYAKVQCWRRIPRAFEVLTWAEAELKEGSSTRSSTVPVLSKKSVQGWLIADLSRTLFKHDPLDMDLVEYVLGLLELPEFCQPDLLVLELHEFLGDDVTRFVLALWKFLVVEIAMRLVFNTSKEALAKQIRSREEQESAERARRSLLLLRETEQAQLKREAESQSKGTRKLQDDATRDYKRRRPTYRGKGSGVKSAQMVLREVLEKQMLGLSMETGWELITDGNGDDEVGQNGPSSQRTPQDSARTSVGEWMSLTDALRKREQQQKQATQIQSTA
ncbi:hypothetical protein Gpo141_00003211 [Globisporangium polare]